MSLWIEWDGRASVVPGQFINVYINDPARLLPRPISICDVTDRGLRMVYRITGEATGTAELSGYQAGETIRITGPVGNGYPLDDIMGKKTVLMGGGIGIPPMLYLTKKLVGGCTVILGYRDSNTFLMEEFENAGAKVFVATDDGSVGTHGTVIDALRESGIEPEVLCACGPKPMLAGIKAYSADHGIPAYISLEERMACGVGACLGCVTSTTHTDPHSHVKNARVCVDGPVFLSDRVEL
ncbi:MAG: dihydroorotate dehydrogenase electron transfer subunit [Lachnospiraceae bacterium]|nr:dihydroorotate dehydrogenase electron transfer subunit [Lachnospiraceae bacterium]